jgi:hypothetical protein
MDSPVELNLSNCLEFLHDDIFFHSDSNECTSWREHEIPEKGIFIEIDFQELLGFFCFLSDSDDSHCRSIVKISVGIQSVVYEKRDPGVFAQVGELSCGTGCCEEEMLEVTRMCEGHKAPVGLPPIMSSEYCEVLFGEKFSQNTLCFVQGFQSNHQMVLSFGREIFAVDSVPLIHQATHFFHLRPDHPVGFKLMMAVRIVHMKIVRTFYH